MTFFPALVMSITHSFYFSSLPNRKNRQDAQGKQPQQPWPQSQSSATPHHVSGGGDERQETTLGAAGNSRDHQEPQPAAVAPQLSHRALPEQQQSDARAVGDLQTQVSHPSGPVAEQAAQLTRGTW